MSITGSLVLRTAEGLAARCTGGARILTRTRTTMTTTVATTPKFVLGRPSQSVCGQVCSKKLSTATSVQVCSPVNARTMPQTRTDRALDLLRRPDAELKDGRSALRLHSRFYTQPVRSAPTIAAVSSSTDIATETLVPSVTIEGDESPEERIFDLGDAATAVSANDVVQIGTLKSMGLVHWTPAGLVQATVEAVHVLSGLPWWASIAVTSVATRLALLPFTLASFRNSAIMQRIQPEMLRISERAKELRGDTAAMLMLSQEMRELHAREGFHPLKSLLIPIIQLPIMVGLFAGINGMANLPAPGFSTGGLLWIPDLTAADPYYVCPVLACVGFMTMMEFATPEMQVTRQQQYMKWAFRAMSVFGVYVTASLPAAVHVFFISSMGFSALQAAIFRLPSVKRALNIPDVPKSALVDSQPRGDKHKSKRKRRQ